ncbi:acyl-CoA dehydrogenase C-terminal domain-containing protein [Paraburkholderia terrae]|uniref:acyl-CoA dehydrogenase C-terminal domain-containing protein n=1 Tax=Paraburkholderia terrae TaxID=311230 RepID=UPI00296B250F|nr:acyl-CoA dehydrogenase C-terminal domain-containing protein [Paraburkholderia terrae]MDW3656627.1 acyl-CoA dehydrogenase C-terminal domain-containing protein [Paraburkholderia terrae]
MPGYDAPIREIRFLLEDVFGYDRNTPTLPGFEEATLDVVLAVLDGAAGFAKDVLVPINLPGDEEGCRFDGGAVKTPNGYREAYDLYRQNGWPALASAPEWGGQGLPPSVALMVREFIASGSMSFGMYPGLSQGAYRAILAHGSDELKRIYLPKLVDGTWTGTMCLTEPDSGSDLSRLRTRAEPEADGSYRVTGTKIFISSGDHDLTENIVHLVLARLPDAPPGTRGLSLFVVPKRLAVDLPGAHASTPNNVNTGSIEHKMGIRAQATAVLNFDGARGWLIGKPHGGLRAMFTMMNSSRVGVAVQSVGVAEISYQNALAYAKERRQGVAPTRPDAPASPARNGGDTRNPIIDHPDVRRSLLTIKALVEGMRAFYLEAALLLDVRAARAGSPEGEDAENRLALLTPVLKSFLSDCALKVTDLGVQLHGGHGYVHENGMEQFYRDARIVPLYEGTNGIQALDLVLRKIGLDDGHVFESWLASVDETAERAATVGALGSMAAAQRLAAARLRDATARLRTWSNDNELEAAGAATDYLQLFGLVALGALWLRMASAAHAGRERQRELASFYNGKLGTAEFFFQRLMPVSEVHFDAVMNGAGALMTLHADEF